MRTTGRCCALLSGVAVALLSVGCGGGGSDDGLRTATLPANLYGWVTNTGSVHSSGDPLRSPVVGDLDAGTLDPGPNAVARGLVGFLLSELPVDITVVSAELRIVQEDMAGTPYATLGDVVVDHVDIGPALDATDYASSLQNDVGTLSTSAAVELKTLSVTSQVQADLAALRPHAGFRLRFQVDSDTDGTDDYVSFDVIPSEGQIPVLVLTYETGP